MTDGPIHLYFGLSYSNYLVLHRTMLQQMPEKWQSKLVALLKELEHRFSAVERPECFIVQAAEEHIVGEMNGKDMRRAGVTHFSDDDDDEFGRFLDKDGNELDRNSRVMIPVDDPIPHYRHAPELLLAGSPGPGFVESGNVNV